MNIFLSFFDGLGAVPHGSLHWTPAPQSFVVVFLITNDAILSKKMQKCAADNSSGFL
jgi:hypothetical protein